LWRLVATGVVAVSLIDSIAGGVARASDPAEDQLIKSGVESRRRQDDAGALALFQKAYELHHSPRAVAQMGLAEFALGRWVEAELHLLEAGAASPDPWIEKNQAVVRDALARVQEHVGDLDVIGQPEGAEIVIEGRVRGRLPLGKPIRVPVGECHFEVRAPGHAPLGRTVQISADRLTRESLNLTPLLVPAAPSAPPGVSIARDTAPRPREDGSRSGLRLASLVAGALGVASVGAGIIFGLEARSAGTTNSAASMFDQDADARGHQYETLQYVGYGAGAALIAAGVVGYWYTSNRSSGGSDARVAIAPLPGAGAALRVGGRF